MPVTRHDRAMAREVAATGWYLGHRAIQAGPACGVCAPAPVEASRSDRLTLLQELHRDAGSKRLPVQPQPFALEARYRAQLRRRMRATRKLLMEALKAEIAPLRKEINERARKDRRDYVESLCDWAGTPADLDAEVTATMVEVMSAVRLDSQSGDVQRLLRVVDRVQRAVEVGSPVTAGSLETLADQVRRFTTRSVTTQLLTVIGIDVLPTLGQASNLLTRWADVNVGLIKSLDQRFFDDIRDAVVATVGEGRSTRALTKALQERYGVSLSRAELIGTDQIGTLNAKITGERQTSLGIEEYIWDNVGDIRVRPEHQDAPTGLGNTVRRWDTPHPTEGHPGEPIRCRCGALPVI